jgi:uncharacterized protein (DUF4415 family)
MKKEYDFSKGKRGPVIQADPNKVRITIRLDKDVLEHYKGVIEEAGGGNYQSLINKVLGENMSRDNGELESTLRKVIREELKRAE